MVLKGKLIFTILFIISIFDCYAFDMLSGQEPFEMSSIIIKEDGIAISAQRIFCTEDGIEMNVNKLQPKKQYSSILFTLEGILNDRKVTFLPKHDNDKQ